jgi:hypothetical protein
MLEPAIQNNRFRMCLVLIKANRHEKGRRCPFSLHCPFTSLRIKTKNQLPQWAQQRPQVAVGDGNLNFYMGAVFVEQSQAACMLLIRRMQCLQLLQSADVAGAGVRPQLAPAHMLRAVP